MMAGKPMSENRRAANSSGFVGRASELHSGKYDYSQVLYTNSYTPVCIVCPEHGEFWQRPSKHLSGQGCPECGKKTTAKAHTQTLEGVLKRFREAHGDFYDYSRVKLGTTSDKVEIICPKHGAFWQIAKAHYQGQGCPRCADESRGNSTRSSTHGFLSRSSHLHSGKYDYRLVGYTDSKSPVCIVCHKHGKFWQRPNDHLSGHGCPVCGRDRKGKSKSCTDFLDFVDSLVEGLEREVRLPNSLGKRWRVDGLLPKKKLGFEFNGLIWHSTKYLDDPKYHYKRWKAAKGEGYRLVFIHEDEWMYRQSAVKNLVRHLLGKSDRLFARKCKIVVVEPHVAKRFYIDNHIQGCHVPPEITYGLTHNGVLVACMSFSRKTSNRFNPYAEGRYELVRFASTASVVGGASKLFKHFVQTYDPDEVVSFSMNHLFSGNLYRVLGFGKDADLPVDYTYFFNGNMLRLHKSNFQHSRLKERFANYDPDLTEEQNCVNNGYYRIYDCGKIRWVWRKVLNG